MTLGEILERSAQRYPDKTAVICQEQQMTFSELNAQSNKLAQALNELGIGKESNVGILMTNRSEFLVSVFGIAKAGARSIPLQTSWQSQEFVHVMDHSNPDAILTDPPYDDLLTMLRPQLPMLRHVITTNEIPGNHKFLSLPAFLKPQSDANITTPVKPDALAMLAYTAGTTGQPKGAMLTHANLLANIVSFGQAIKIQRKDVIYTNLPLSSPFAMMASVILPVFGGMTTVLSDHVLPQPIIRDISEQQVTVFLGFPSMYAALEDMPHLDHYSINSLRLGLCYGTPMERTVMKKFEKLFPCRLFEGYGLSESSSFVSINTPAQHKKGSVGKPLDDRIAWKIADSKGEELPWNTVGELLVKGPNVMKGYYKDEEATHEAIREGWLYTGDMARMDEHGFVFMTGRKADMITLENETISPKSIEQLLMQHLDIQDAGVVDVDIPGQGKRLKAYIVPVPGERIETQDILEFCLEHRDPHEIPDSVDIIDYIPRTMTGEILRRELRAIAQGLPVALSEEEEHGMTHKTARMPSGISFAVNFEQILRDLVTEAPGGIAGTLSGLDGVGISSYSMDPNFPTLVADAELAAIMSASRGISETLDAGTTKESCFIADRYGFITRQLGQYILTLVADAEQLDWGRIPSLFDKFVPMIAQQLV